MKHNKRSVQNLIIAAAVIFLILLSVICAWVAKDASLDRERRHLRLLADACGGELYYALAAKENLLRGAFSGDMPGVEEIRKSLLKIKEKGSFIPAKEIDVLEREQREACLLAGENPGEVIVGPGETDEKNQPILYMTKAVYMEGSIAGYVQVQIVMSDIYRELRQSRESLSEGEACFVVNEKGEVILPEHVRQKIPYMSEKEAGSELITFYEVDKGTPGTRQQMMAYSEVEFRGEVFRVYVCEDVENIYGPLVRVCLTLLALFVLLGAVVCVMGYREYVQRKTEVSQNKTTALLTGAVAHEFNNLMTPIAIYTELLKENEEVNAAMGQEVQELNEAVQRCEELAGQMLEYSRYGRTKKVLKKYNITMALHTAISMVEKTVPENIHMHTQITQTGYFVYGQMGAMHQILYNLVRNSVQAIGQREGNIWVKFGRKAEEHSMVCLIVEDDGGGIPKEIQKYVFTPFFTTKENEGGSGIGLTVVRRLAEEHGGSLQASVTEGRGTAIYVDIPIYEQEKGL